MATEINNLFRSKLRQKLLRYWLRHPQKSFYVNELAGLIKEDPGNCSRELKKLNKMGLVTSVRKGTLKFYFLNPTHPDLTKFKDLFELTEPQGKIKTVFFIAGPNGSGKSTVAKRIVNGINLPFLNADEIAAKLSPNDFNKVRLQAGKSFLNQIEKNIQQGKSFIVETTFAGRYWNHWIRVLKQKKYRLHTLYLCVADASEAVLRIHVRVEKGGHTVPEEDIRRRFQRSKTNFWNLYRKEMDYWEIYLNSKDELIRVAFGGKDDVQVIREQSFQLFKEGIQ